MNRRRKTHKLDLFKMVKKLTIQECMTRKDRLEAIGMRGTKLRQTQAAVAWMKLQLLMIEMSQPESPRTPKFNDLLLAIWRAYVRAKHPKIRSELPPRQEQPDLRDTPGV